jgi:hypothetical protein
MFQDLTQGALYDTDTAMEVMEQISLMEMLDYEGSSNKKSRARLNNANRQKVSAPKFKKKLARPAKRIDIGNAVLTEAKSMEELVETNDYSFNPDEFEKVETVEELLGIELIAEPVIDEELAPVNKICDVELATKVAMDILEGNIPDMRIEDFLPEVWAEGWMIANESYYSEPNNDDEDEVMPSGETIMKLSDKNKDFLINRAKSISSWKQEDGAEMNEVSDEYIYEDDEVNVLEECDVTLMGFRKGFWCMGLAA